jgi:hypothetical protein
MEPEVEDRPGDRAAIDLEVLLGQVQAARAHHQRRGPRAERVLLAGGRVGVADGPRHGVAHVRLAFDEVLPAGRVGVLEVSHEDARSGVERVDDHLPVDGSGDLDAPVRKVLRDRRPLKVRLAHRARLGQEIEALPSVKAGLDRPPPFNELAHAGRERPREIADEADRFRREHLRLAGNRSRRDADIGRKGGGAGGLRHELTPWTDSNESNATRCYRASFCHADDKVNKQLELKQLIVSTKNIYLLSTCQYCKLSVANPTISGRFRCLMHRFSGRKFGRSGAGRT